MLSTLSNTEQTGSSTSTVWLSQNDLLSNLPPHRKITIQAKMESPPIRLLLMDQDPVSRPIIRRLLLPQTDFQLIDEIEYRRFTLERVSALRPDALIVDVQTLGSSGFDIEAFLSQTFRPIVVFLTGQKDFAIEAFELGATDYLLKPLGKDRFERALERIRQQHHHRIEAVAKLRKRISVTDRRRTHLIDPDLIEWVSAAGDYTELHVSGTTHLLRERFSAFIERLPTDAFCRIHRSSAVNLRRISGYKALRNQDLLVRLNDKTILRASRTFSNEFKRALSKQCV